MKLSLSRRTYVVLYLAANLGLTLYNKAVLGSCPYPYLLTSIHALSCLYPTYKLRSFGNREPRQLSWAEMRVIVAFSVLYSMNIAMSNLSLALVSIPLHQTVRAIAPFFALVLSYFMFGESHAIKVWLSLVPVVAGVMLASAEEFDPKQIASYGVPVTMVGALLAALKTILTGRLQKQLHMSSPDLLFRVSSFAWVQALCISFIAGEITKLPKLTPGLCAAVFGNGLMAMLLNLVSFGAIREVGPVSMIVAANVKQVLAIALGSFLFHASQTLHQWCGVSLTLVGGALFSMLTMRAKHAEQKRDVLPIASSAAVAEK